MRLLSNNMLKDKRMIDSLLASKLKNKNKAVSSFKRENKKKQKF